MSKPKPLTPDQVRERMRRKGIPLAQWARDNNFPLTAVYRVMGGQYKGYFGQAHEIAVALGLKVPDAQPSSPSAGGNTQLQAVA